MADNEKYYYLRLKEDFFEDDAIQILEAIPDGYLYSNILLKLYLKSLKFSGKLMFNERIPYNSTVLATITRHNVGTVEKALDIFKELGLIEILDNGAMYMLDIQNFIGKTSTEADRKRAYRERIEQEKLELKGQMSGQISDKSTPEIEIEKEIEIEIEREKNNYQQIADMYNEICISFPRLTKLSEARKKAIKARLNTYQVEDFKKLFEMAEESDFLKGKNKQNWSATFDWLIKDANMVKVLDGNYKNKAGGQKAVSNNKFNNFQQRTYDYEDLERQLLENRGD